MSPNNFINTPVTRTYCNPCSCGAKENPKLFPELTSSKVAAALGKITKQPELVHWLGVSQIQIFKDRDEWKFSRGICKSVQNKLREKIAALKITSLDQGDLFDTGDNLLPASDPDDIPPSSSQISNPGAILNFDDPVRTASDDFPLPNRGWDWKKATDSDPIFY